MDKDKTVWQFEMKPWPDISNDHSVRYRSELKGSPSYWHKLPVVPDDAIEALARALCVADGKDPDEILDYKHPDLKRWGKHRQWREYATQAQEHLVKQLR